METPASIPQSLLAHDGELEDVRAVMTGLGLAVDERRGRTTEADERTPWNLVVATPRRLLEFDVGAVGSPPLRIAILDKDSRTLRAMLQRNGIDLIVRRPVHPAALRLLFLYSLYRGPEKRRTTRVSIGAPVRLRVGWRRRSAVLADLSETGCRLLSSQALPRGANVRIAIPVGIAGGRAFTLPGSVVRTTPAGVELPGVRVVAVTFRRLSASARERLDATVQAHRSGPASMNEEMPLEPTAGRPGASQTAAPGAAFQGTEPAAASQPDAGALEPEDRRGAPRREYPHHVVGLGAEAARVLIGRDISAGGMRVDPDSDVSVGDMLRLGLYVQLRDEPLVVDARVERDDGDLGLALRFYDLEPPRTVELERMIRSLPILATRESRRGGDGIIVSEILGRETRGAGGSG